jgi:tetratricopeptide (TPR) repeat protein/MinD-like ATPase involved in chromosome partitioning or flagellar assembly
MSMTSKPLGKIITFYSYKGGTGRSMALANVACVLGQKRDNLKVLMIDWDLEAPGLYRYFQNRIVSNTFHSFENQLGLIDLFCKASLFCEERNLTDEDIPDNIFEIIGIEEYIVETNIQSLYLMTSGMLDKTYSFRVANFDWSEMFTKYPSLIYKLTEYLAKEFDWTLVDSRSGHTDISGICTALMPDRLVVVFTPNTQSLSGVLNTAKNAIEYRKQSDDLRQLIVFPLVSRVEPAEPKLRMDWRFGNKNKELIGYEEQFESLFTEVYGLSQCSLRTYFDDVQIQYISRYAYGEEIAVLIERTEDRLSIARSYESFTQRLIEQERPWENTFINENAILPASNASTSETQASKSGGRRIEKTVFICYRRTNASWALAIYQNLSMHGYDVFFDYQSIPSGRFEHAIIENIKSRAHFIVVLTPSGLEKCKDPGDWFRREIETAIDAKRNIVPLLLENFNFGSPLVKDALRGKLAALAMFNGLNVYSEYFFEAMDKLRELYLNVPVSLPQPDELEDLTDLQKIVVNNAGPVEKAQLTAQEWLEQGYSFQQDRILDKALECYSEALRLDPSSAYAYSSVGYVLKDLKRYDEAEADFRKAIELDPSSAYAYLGLGQMLSDLKRYDEAETAYRRVIELNHSFAFAYSSLGDVLINLKRYDEAEVTFRKAIELDPSFGYYHTRLGHLLKSLKRYQEAEAALRKAIELDPSSALPYSSLGEVLINLKRYDEAGAALRKAIELDPSFAYDYSSLGYVLINLKRYDEAEVAYRKAIELDPLSAYAYYMLGNLLKYLRRFDEAEAAYRNAIRLSPLVSKAYGKLALLLRIENRNEEALALLQKQVEIDPEDFNPYLAIASINKQMGKNVSGEILGKARQFMPKDHWYSRACLESVSGNYNQALKYLQRAAQQHHFDPVWAWEDPDLQWIRDNPRFAEIVGPRKK